MGGEAVNEPVLIVATPRRREHLETFVRAHLEHLPARTRLLHGGKLMRLRINGRPLMGPVARGASKVLAHRAPWVGRCAGERALKSCLRREGVDAVLAEFGPTGVMLASACARARVPLVVHFHGYDAYAELPLGHFASAYRRLFASAAAIVVVSRPMQRQLEQLGAPPDKLRLVPCGADVARLPQAKPAAAPPHFVAVGRFVHKKSPQRMLHAFAKLLAQRPSAQLEMVGDGPLLPRCRSLAAELGLAHAVTFRGAVSHRKVMAILAQSRGFVHHAVRAADGDCEGTPVALLEASGAGLPVVSTRHAGIPDAVVEGETGFLVDEGDVDRMAAHLLRLTDDPELAGRLGRGGRDFIARHHSLERRIGELWAVIEAVLEPRSPS